MLIREARARQSGEVLRARLEQAVANPGPDSASFVAGLDPRKLDPFDQVLVVQAWEAHRCWVDAQQQHALVALAGHEPPPEEQWDVGSEEVRLALRLSHTGTVRRLGLARALTSSHTPTLDALEAGKITWSHARTIVEGTEGLDPDAVAAVQQTVLDRAAEQTVANLRRSVRRAVLRVRPHEAAEAHARARAGRGVRHYPGEDAMGELLCHGDALGTQIMWQAYDLRARQLREQARRDGTDDGRSIDAWRFDAALDLAERFLSDPTLPSAHGRPVTAFVVIDLPTAIGLAEHPAQLRGYGPIPAAVGRAIIRDAGSWRILITDAQTGRLLAVDRYRPGQALRDLLTIAHDRCWTPGCNQPAYRGELDHTVNHREGGATDDVNLHPRCKGHHEGKTRGHCTATVEPDGSGTWTPPSGHHYRIRPPRVLDDDGGGPDPP